MKKTLVALSVLASLPMLAQSSEITIYGKIDVGLAYTSVDHGLDGVDTTNKLADDERPDRRQPCRYARL